MCTQSVVLVTAQQIVALVAISLTVLQVVLEGIANKLTNALDTFQHQVYLLFLSLHVISTNLNIGRFSKINIKFLENKLMLHRQKKTKMKINTSLLLFFIISFCHAQNKGTITSKEITPKAGRENHYIYLPPTGLLLPKKIAILVVYQSRQTFYQKSIPLFKEATGFSFSFKSPD